MEYICFLKSEQIVEIDNSYFKVKNIQEVNKTKRRYESSAWWPKGAEYDSYKLSLTNVFTNEHISCVYKASTKFKIIEPIITKYSVIDINECIISLLTEDLVSTNMNISDIDIDPCTYNKINNYLGDMNIGEIIIDVISGPNILKIINLQTVKCIE